MGHGKLLMTARQQVLIYTYNQGWQEIREKYAYQNFSSEMGNFQELKVGTNVIVTDNIHIKNIKRNVFESSFDAEKKLKQII